MIKCVFELLPCIGDGGAETLVKDYCLHINPSLIKIVVVTITPPNKKSACYQVLSSSGIEIISIYNKTKLFKSNLINRVWFKLFDTRYVSRRINELVSRYKPVAIHSHLSVLRYIKASLNVLADTRLIATCHSEFDINFNIPIELKSAKYLAQKGQIRFVALHKSMQDDLNKRLKCDNTIIVNNAIDFNRFINNFSKECVREMLAVPQDAFVIGHVGRFNDVKNHDFLVDIFAEVKKRRPDSYLLMVGNGVNKQRIQDKLESLNLSDSSMILSDRDDVNIILKAMDIFVFPSLYEGLPVSLVEAQVVGLRAIVSNTITEECFFSENVVSLSLSDSIDRWVDYILDNAIKSSYQRDILDFDIDREIRKLENLYLGYL